MRRVRPTEVALGRGWVEIMPYGEGEEGADSLDFTIEVTETDGAA